MIRTAAPAQLGREFDDFLFSPIGEERNGSTLSVVSALARSDVDPWQEAAKLARLPRTTATERLAGIIAALPDATSFDAGTIAARLIALLPRNVVAAVASREQPLVGPANQNQPVKPVVIYVILLALVMGASSIMGGQQPPPQEGSAGATAPSAASAQTGTVPIGK